MKPALLLLGLSVLLLAVLYFERQDRRRKRIALIDADQREWDRVEAQRLRQQRFIRDSLVPPAVREARQRYIESVKIEDCELGVFIPLTDPKAVAHYVSVAPAFGARKGAA